jgi:hypothetical protein
MSRSSSTTTTGLEFRSPRSFEEVLKVVLAPTAEKLDLHQTQIQVFEDTGARYAFPLHVSPKRVPFDQTCSERYQDEEGALAFLSAQEALSKLNPSTRELLRLCSPSGLAETAFAELHSHGLMKISTSLNLKLYWLENQYLGTWSDPSYAVNAFLEWSGFKSTEAVDDLNAAYKRLYSFLPIKEFILPNGRVAVSLIEPLDLGLRLGLHAYLKRNATPWHKDTILG